MEGPFVNQPFLKSDLPLRIENEMENESQCILLWCFSGNHQPKSKLIFAEENYNYYLRINNELKTGSTERALPMEGL